MDRYNGSFQNERSAALKVSHLERKWQQVLEEERKSYSRNKKLLEDFDRIEQQSEVYAKKTDRLKQAKHDFELYVSSVYPKWTKEIKRLQQAKEKKTAKDITPLSVMGDRGNKDHKGKKHSGISLGNEDVLPHPTFSSTPHRNGVDLEEAEQMQHPLGFHKYRKKAAGEHHRNNKHHPNHDGYSSGHPMSSMSEPENSGSWYHSVGFPHPMFPYVGTFPLPRQPYAVPWGSVPYSFQGRPSHGIDSKLRSNTGSINDYEQPVFSNSFQEYQVHPRFSRGSNMDNSVARTFEEFYRDPRNDGFDDQVPGPRSIKGYYMDQGIFKGDHESEVFQGYHKDERNRNSDIAETKNFKQYNDLGFGNSKISPQEKQTKEGFESDNNRKALHDFKNTVDQYQCNQEHLQNSRNENISGHKKGAGKSAKNRDPDDKFSGKLNTKVSEESRKTEMDVKPDRSPGDVKLLKQQINSLVHVNLPETDGNQIIKKQEDQAGKEVAKGGSSLPSAIRKLEGNLKVGCGEIYDTEQVSEVAGSELSKSDASLLRSNKEKDKELQNTTSSVLGTQVETASVEKKLDEEVPGNKGIKTSIMDDLLGEDVSDFEVSSSQDSENASGINELVSEGEHSKIAEHISQKSNVEMDKDLAAITSGKVSQSRMTEIDVSGSDGHSSSSEQINVDEGKRHTDTRTKLDMKDGLGGNTKTEESNEDEERDLNKDESMRQKQRLHDNIELTVEQDREGRPLLVDEKTFLTLLHVVDDDIEVSFSKELLYRNPESSTEKREEILRVAESGESLDHFDPAVISMVLLDQLPHVVRSSGKGCLISDEILIKQKNCLNEKDLRNYIDGSLTVLWKNLFSHFLKMMQNNVMNAQQIAEIFAQHLVSRNCTSIEKAVNLLGRILSNSYESYHQNDTHIKEELSENLDPLSDRPAEEQKSDEEKSKSGILEQLSFTSGDSISDHAPSNENNGRNRNGNKSERREDMSYSEDFEDEKSMSLTETDAYKKMLSSMKVSHQDEDIEEDFLGEGGLSEGNVTSEAHEDHITQQSPRQQPALNSSSTSKNLKKNLKSKPKLSLFGSGEENDFGNSFGNDNEGIMTSSWKSSEISLSPPLSADLEIGGYVPTVAGEKEVEGKDAKEKNRRIKEPDQRKGVLAVTEKEQVALKTGASKATQESKTRSRIKAGFWNHSDTESELDLQVSHVADGDDHDADDFDFYS